MIFSEKNSLYLTTCSYCLMMNYFIQGLLHLSCPQFHKLFETESSTALNSINMCKLIEKACFIFPGAKILSVK